MLIRPVLAIKPVSPCWCTRKAAALHLPRERQSADHGAVMSCAVIIWWVRCEKWSCDEWWCEWWCERRGCDKWGVRSKCEKWSCEEWWCDKWCEKWRCDKWGVRSGAVMSCAVISEVIDVDELCCDKWGVRSGPVMSCEGGAADGRRRRSGGIQAKNKNPTQWCGELWLIDPSCGSRAC